jgi:hypothetical protein
MKTIKFKKNGVRLRWYISVDNPFLGVYDFSYYLKNHLVFFHTPQRTDDVITDNFEIPYNANVLKDYSLWVRVKLSDPNNQGGNCKVTLKIKQGNKELGKVNYTRVIPAGDGTEARVSELFEFEEN